MNIPGTLYQLAVLLVLVMPGIVYAAVRHQLRGPVPEDRDFSVRVLRAMMVSAGLDCAYAIAFGPRLYDLTTPGQGAASTRAGALFAHARAAGLWGILLVFVLPALLAYVLHAWVWSRGKKPERRVGNSPIPSAWDWSGLKRGSGCFVRLRLHDGRFVGGWLGRDAFVSMHPEPRDMFIDIQWELNDCGRFIQAMPWAHGMYVNAADVDVVEWLRAPAAAEDPRPSVGPRS